MQRTRINMYFSYLTIVFVTIISVTNTLYATKTDIQDLAQQLGGAAVNNFILSVPKNNETEIWTPVKDDIINFHPIRLPSNDTTWLALSHDESSLISTTYLHKNYITLWNLKGIFARSEIITCKGPISALFVLNARQCVVGSSIGELLIVNNTKQEHKKVDIKRKFPKGIKAISVTKQGLTLTFSDDTVQENALMKSSPESNNAAPDILDKKRDPHVAPKKELERSSSFESFLSALSILIG